MFAADALGTLLAAPSAWAECLNCAPVLWFSGQCCISSGLHNCKLLKHVVQEVRVDMQVVHTNGDSGTPRSNSGLGKDPESQARPFPASICDSAPARCACRSTCVVHF